ncbi:MAG: tetratricopeptide repeat protein [Gemmatimonadetes bacterium]|nr:tetratricopeptide repeat protein [Gemmatimonadota bacterium]MXX71024.1 tetratricopeptide repeat protein [Gemmatimonadota bacterium]MYC92594.1 tetratricopeptide repeat protein [Gemmatimonadota bacterium]MYG36375.1 tetratricopeptide repeat protein [Gemmatimonadota bacterium]
MKETGRRVRSGWRAAMIAGLAVLVGGCDTEDGLETPRARGDRAFARADYEDALAEYRLYMREDPGIDATLRTAHTYAILGRVDEARVLYDEAVREDSTHAEQAVSDFVSRAREAFAAGDQYGGASAMETAALFRPGIVVEDLVLPMARHYSNSGQHTRAQPLYLRVLGSQRRDPDIVLEAALAHQEIGDCERALEFFDEFIELARRRERETRWYVGSCAFQLAQEHIARPAFQEALARAAAERADTVGPELSGEPPIPETGVQEVADDAAAEDILGQVLGYLDLVLELEEPRTTLPQAYFEKADILARLGECDAAVAAYGMVAVVDVSGSGTLARQARQRVDQIRFAAGEGPC